MNTNNAGNANIKNNNNKNDTERKPKSKTKSKAKIIILSIVLLILASLVAVVVYTVGFHVPSNQIDETKPFQTHPSTQPTESNESTNQTDFTEEQKKIFNFLVIGRDQTGANTDVIMIINYNVMTGKISVLQIPRDTYVEFNGISYKINSLYAVFYAEGQNKNEKSPDNYSLKKLANTLEKNLCINIHYYSMVNLIGFRNIVDILGGVKLDIPADMDYDDPSQDLHIHLKKGLQTLNGKKAEEFVRFRSGYVQADIGRMDAQKIFMSSLLKTVKENFNITTIVKIANEVYKNVITDLPLDDMVFFAKNILSIDMNNITFMSMPGKSARSNGDDGIWYYVMNRKAVINIIQKYFNIYSDVVIDDVIFDPNRVFTSLKKYPHINSLYNEETEIDENSHSASSINEDGIKIPRY